MEKPYPDTASALGGILFDGMIIMAGGFGLAENRIIALRASGPHEAFSLRGRHRPAPELS